jgi:hypothetical protein
MRALMVAVVVAVGLVAWSAWRIEATVARVRQVEQEIRKMQPLVSRWREADGTEHTVSTPQREGESDADYIARHGARVKAMKALFPPAP